MCNSPWSIKVMEVSRIANSAADIALCLLLSTHGSFVDPSPFIQCKLLTLRSSTGEGSWSGLVFLVAHVAPLARAYGRALRLKARLMSFEIGDEVEVDQAGAWCDAEVAARERRRDRTLGFLESTLKRIRQSLPRHEHSKES